MIEKTAYAVIVAAKKLRLYFNAHQVVVLTDLLLEKSLEKIKRSGCLAIKGQALADIFAE